MNPESFHVIQEILNEPYGPMMVVSIIVLLPVGLAFAYWVYRRRVHPVAVWAILAVATWCGSQIFPENRSQAGELVFWAAGMSAAITAVMFHMIRRERRRQAGEQGRFAEAKRPPLFRE
jgi:hypothetical membrane protein